MESSLTRRCAVCGYRYDAAMDFCPIDRRVLPPADPAVADLGNYRLVERLGDGGMGAVYRAVHRRLGRVVAIKLLQRELSNDRGIINRFFHEARAANTIRHEHVIEVFDFVEGERSGEDVYFVMEFLHGEDLHDAIHRHGPRPMDPQRAGSILEQIAAALYATHARNIVHRDLKPENVFLAEKDGLRDYVKIFDFGVAKLERPDGRSTIEGAVLGTPEYMAPEQARGAAVDGRADIYSLGCIAYEMLTCRQVFGGGTQSEVLVRQMTEVPPPLRSLVPSLPAALDDAVMQALAKDPGRRPQTALVFAESIAQALGRDLEHSASFRLPSRVTPARLTPSGGLVLRKERGTWGPIAIGTVVVTLLTGAVVTAKLRRGPSGAAGTADEVVAQVSPSPAAVPPTPLVTVLLQSIPSGADILDEHGATIGITPHGLVVPSGTKRRVRFQKAGFRAVDRQLQASGDTTIAVTLDPEGHARRRQGRGPHGRGLDSTAGTIDPFAR